MKTKIRTELEKSIMSDDMLGFREELIKKLSRRIKTLSTEELWPVFQKAAGNSSIEWEALNEPVYDDGIDYSSKTRRIKSQLVDTFVHDIIDFILRRRNALRFDCKKTIDIWPVESHRGEHSLARSKNISASGILLRSRLPYRNGQKLEMEVRSRASDDPIKIIGSVVRSEQSARSIFDIGVTIDSIQGSGEMPLCTNEEAAYRLSHGGR